MQPIPSLDRLPPLALRVLALRLGVDGRGPRDRDAVARELGSHPRFVARIEDNAIALLGPADWSRLREAAAGEPGAEVAPGDGA